MTTRITSWSQLHEHLTAAYAPVKELGDQYVELSTTASDGPRALTVRTSSAFGFDMLEVRCALGPAREVPPTGALLRNVNRIIGPFGVAQGSLIVRQLLPLHGLAVERLDEVLKTITQRFDPES